MARKIKEELKEIKYKEMINLYIRTTKEGFKFEPLYTSLYLITKIINVFFPIYSLLILQDIINEAVTGSFALNLIIVLIIVIILEDIFKKITEIIFVKYNHNMSLKTELALYDKLHKLSIQDFEIKSLHDDFSRASDASFQISAHFNSMINFITTLIQSVTYFILIIAFQPILLIIMFPFILIIYIIKYKVSKKHFIEEWELPKYRRKMRYYSELLRKQQSIKELKLLNIDRIYANKYKQNYNYREKEIYRITKEEIKESLITENLTTILSTSILIYLVYSLSQGFLLIGNFNTYRVAINRSLRSLSTLAINISNRGVSLIEIREYFKFMDYESIFKDGTTKINDIKSIEFKNVSFSYPASQEQVLHNVSFKINKGEKVAFIGENGSGKTTTMNLLMNIYHPTKGEVLINKMPTTEIESRSLRNQITMLLQDYTLFEETIRENITFETKEQDDEKIYSKMPFEKLKAKIKNYEKQLDTILGSWFGEGLMLSKGQIQKLALSRIFYRDTDCFILDEPNSALDPKATKTLFKYIFKQNKEKIYILTLHEFTNLNKMDKVIMFENGRKVAEGKHEDLYKNVKKYKEYYNCQETDNE